jgi:hypothetical protein
MDSVAAASCDSNADVNLSAEQPQGSRGTKLIMNLSLSNSSRRSLSGRLSNLFHQKPTIDVPPTVSMPKRFPYGQFQLQIELPVSGQYSLEATTDLKNWTVIASESVRGQKVEYLDPTAANFSFRFYRVRAGELYSPKVVGYATLSIPPGFAMVANPLQAVDNSVQALFPKLPEGTTLTKFDTHLFKLTKNVFDGNQWSNPSETLLPGEGAIIFNPSSAFKTLSMVGEVQQGDLSLPIPAGFSIRSSIVPVPGQLEADLLFPAADDDIVHVFDRDRQAYVIYSVKNGKWSPDAPVIGVGESFWVGKTFGGNWNRTLSLNQPPDLSTGAV